MNWHVTMEETKVIAEIARRAILLAEEVGIEYNQCDAVMDLTAIHANGCKLKLHELVDAPKFDFAHDVFGIRLHINRRTGQLKNCFLPRYAEPA